MNVMVRVPSQCAVIPPLLPPPRSGRQPAAVYPVLPAAAGGWGEAAPDVPPGAAVSGSVAGRTPGAGAGGGGSALRAGQ